MSILPTEVIPWRAITSISVVLAACAGEPARRMGPDTAIVLSESAYRSLPILRLTEGPLLCGVEGPPCVLGGIRDVSSHPRGDIVFTGVVGKQPQVIRVDSGSRSGKLLGRVGDGPGEYRAVIAVGLAPDRDALVFAPRERRWIRYAYDGRGAAIGLVPLPSGLMRAAFVRGELRALATDNANRRGDSAQVVMFALDSGSREPRRLHSIDVWQRAYDLSDLRPLRVPFSPRARWSVRPDGSVVLARGARMLIDLFDSTGHHTLRFGFESTPRQVTQRDLDRALKDRLRGVGDPRMRAALEESVREGAARHPAITELAAPSNGQIWAREAPREAADSVMWVVFSVHGSAIGRVATGADDAIVAARGDTILVARSGNPTAEDALQWMLLINDSTASGLAPSSQ